MFVAIEKEGVWWLSTKAQKESKKEKVKNSAQLSKPLINWPKIWDMIKETHKVKKLEEKLS